MKSRKLGLFGKQRASRRTAKPQSKLALRRGIVEPLEKREMLNADWNADEFVSTSWFLDQASQDATVAYLESRINGDSGSGSSSPEGGPSDILTVAEVESNDGFGNSQLVPLEGNLGVNIIGGNFTAVDEDWYAVDLPAGAIIDARLAVSAGATANIPLMSLYNSSNVEMVSTTALPTPAPASPLTGSGASPTNFSDIALHYVVPTAGRYHFRVSDVGSSYTLSLRQYRPVLESEAVGTKQIIFLDFDGAIVNTNLFWPLPGSSRLSPTRNFMAQYGIQDSDYNAFVDEVVARVQAKFDALGQNTTNPNYAVEIRNSKDHPDPWGQPNVSRVIIGGTWQELVRDPAAASSGILGISESIDPGNFDTTETAIVMHDVLLTTVNTVPVDPFARRIDVIAELMTFVIVHEAGHYLGGWHQDPNNATLSIMDQFYNPVVTSGAGADGIFGNADDALVQFASDGFSAGGQPFEPGGINDVVSWLGWGLSGGQAGGIVTGATFNDRNLNRTLDNGDSGLAGTRIYADANGDGVYNVGEYTTLSDSLGNYSLRLPVGTHVIREVVPSGYRLTTPTSNARTVTVGLGATVAGQHFGQELLNQDFTGFKWNDINGNGLRDTGENGIQGVWMYIDADGDNRIDIGEISTQTAADGSYKLTFPGPGTYTIREVIDPGYVQTFPGPSLDNEHTITVTGNPAIDASVIAGLNFGNTLTIDFGDAPSSYGVASHGFTPGLKLGVNWDAEQVSQFSSTATGDDSSGAIGGDGLIIDDEDGVILSRPLVAGSTNNRVSVTAENTTGTTAYLSGWVDFNQDGDFGDAGEQVISNQVLATGTSEVTFAAPSSARLGNTFARFRYSTQQGLPATGGATSGEVEDYIFNVTDTLQIAVDDNYTVSRNSSLNSLDVLSNDFSLPGETLSIVSLGASAAGGTVQISSTGTVLYTPPSGFIGQDVFSYTMQNSGGDIDTASVVVDVSLFFEDPFAVDDSFDIATNIIDSPLNVLANDIEGQNGALRIVSVTQPDRGGQINIASGGQSLRYTPARGFGGTEVFTYTVADSSGTTSSAEVTLHTLPGDRNDDDVLIQLVATDLSGNPITAIQQGQEFQIQMFVDDLRFDAANPGNAAGVYAAYTDLLYNLQLVSTVPSSNPTDQFNYEVSFFNDYFNFQTGDATIPGIINEFGAFSERAVMNDPSPVLLAAVTFSARSPGIASFTPDPADSFPLSDSLLFDTPGSAVPVERIRYLSTSLEIVGDGVEFPVAVDDSLASAIPAGTINFPIDVLANDRPGSTGQISLVSSTNGLFGTTRIDTRGTASPADDRVLYTPNGGFNGADQFTYTIQDIRGIQSIATVTVRVGAADDNDIIALRLSATDLSGQPIDEIIVGGQFQLRGYVQDIRGFGIDRGAFAAYEDVLYSANLVSPIASTTNDPNLGFQVQFGPNYQRVREGDIRTAGLINEIGAVQIENANQPLGSDEQLLFIVTMTANSVGLANFIADPADILPAHDTLTFEPPVAVSFDQIRYGSDMLNIVSSGGSGGGEGYFNSSNPYDVNDDGFVTPIDALGVINWLNSGGSRTLPGGGGEGENGSGGHMYVDTNNDGALSPLDALLVINHLNGGSGNGEGELSAILSSGSLAVSAGGVESDPFVGEDVGLPVAPVGKVGVRMTDYNYGPSQSDLHVATDFLFAVSGSEHADDLLSDLAPDIDEMWKKKSLT